MDTTYVAQPIAEGDPDSDSDNFEDAHSSLELEPKTSFLPPTSPVDHAKGIAALQKTADLTNDNKHLEAEAMLKPWVDTSMYHSLAYATLQFVKAAMSNDSESLRLARTALHSSLELSNRCRKDTSFLRTISNWVFGQNLDEYSETELAAEMFYTESNLMLTLLAFLQDENLISFIKGGLKVRKCFGHYKDMYAWLQRRKLQGRPVDVTFAMGVYQGIGCFSLFVSVLPNRILRLLEFIGFSGDTNVGCDLLTKAAESGTFRSTICTGFLLFYHSVAAVFLGSTDLQTDFSERVLQPHLDQHPKSPMFLYLKGRISLMRGDVDKAMEAFQTILEEPIQWEQIHHLTWWEMMWCHCYKMEWAIAASYADKLFKGCKWSQATFLYQKAALLLMLKSSTQPNVPGATGSNVAAMMKEIPPLKQRIAGKSIPVEKLAVAKSQRYLRGESLPLPVLEMMYAWNGFHVLAMNPPLLENMLVCVLSEIALVEETKYVNPYYVDDYVVVNLIQGVCLRELKRYDEAERTFKNILKCSAGVKHDLHAVAAARMELGLVYMETNRLHDAERALEATMTAYKGYHLESRIHFRVHAGLSKVAQLKATTT